MGKYPIVRQLDSMDCGAACLAMVCAEYGLDQSLAQLRENTYVDREGVSMLNIKSAAEKIGLETLPVRCNYHKLLYDLPLPAIAHWDQNHFVVVYEVGDEEVIIGDPAVGERKISRQEFIKNWADIDHGEGVLLLLEVPDAEEEISSPIAVAPDSKIDQDEVATKPQEVKKIKPLDNAMPVQAALSTAGFLSLLKGNRKFWFHVIFGSIILFLIYLFLPLVIKELIDSGALLKNHNLVHTGLFAFAMLGLGRIILELSRNWMFQQEAALTNAKLVSTYLEKLTQQPIRFFEKRLKWDILQRVYDNYKVGAFFQSSSVQAIFYLIMLLSSCVVLLLLHESLFLLFFVGIVLQIGVILYFKQRRLYAKQNLMQASAKSQDVLFEIINGISAIKLNNAEAYNQSVWEQNQASLLDARLSFNKVDQFQKTAIKIVGWLVELGMLYFALHYMMKGTFSLGSLMAVVYILAYSKNAVVELFDLLIDFQEVQLSLRRLSELSDLGVKKYEVPAHAHLSTYKDIHIEDLMFRYGDIDSPTVLNDTSFVIPKGKKTAIVGVSGSGKTTLIKLMVGMYAPNSGRVTLGDVNVQDVNPALLHAKLGVVFEDGHIFSDSIASNVTMMSTRPDKRRLSEAIRIACLETFTKALPLGMQTRIGEDGVQLSKGQKQQVLLARLFYKSPDILLIDEATNALDGITERRILKNIDEEYHDKTTLFVAHRLSTIKDADHIVVLHKGMIVEQGTHEALLQKRGAYFLILRNDLE